MVKASGTLFILPDVPITVLVATTRRAGIRGRGEELTEEKIQSIIREIKGKSFAGRCYFSGGDPFFHPEEFLLLLETGERGDGDECVVLYRI